MKIKHKVLVNFMRDQTGLAPSRHRPVPPPPLLILPFACSNKAINCGKTYSERRERVRDLIAKNIKVMLWQLVLEIAQTMQFLFTYYSYATWGLTLLAADESNQIIDKSNERQIKWKTNQIKVKFKSNSKSKSASKCVLLNNFKLEFAVKVAPVMLLWLPYNKR